MLTADHLTRGSDWYNWLLAAHFSGRSLADISAQSKMPIDDLVEWASHPAIAPVIANIQAFIAKREADLAPVRSNQAANGLVKALSSPNYETVRKAATQLLKGAPYTTRDRADKPAQPSASGNAAARTASSSSQPAASRADSSASTHAHAQSESQRASTANAENSQTASATTSSATAHQSHSTQSQESQATASTQSETTAASSDANAVKDAAAAEQESTQSAAQSNSPAASSPDDTSTTVSATATTASATATSVAETPATSSPSRAHARDRPLAA